ncbi:MAG TPA: amidohydrolase family protein, partial [Blastocatellia bacterium]|nr:amidohydrolase family protein [Blastocatellia bacterium]
MKYISIVVALLAITILSLASSSSRPSQAAGIAIKCGRLIDEKADSPIANAIILINRDRITAVGPGLEIPAGARIIDLSNMTVLPGLIDTHTHLTYHYDQKSAERPAITAIYAAENARKTLDAGFTTVRNLGAGERVDLDLRDL